MLYKKKEEPLSGSLDLMIREHEDAEFSVYIFTELKKLGIINGYYITFIYGNYDNLIYFNDDYNGILGNLVIGDDS